MTPRELLTLERRISPERFAPYRAAAGDDLERAIRRYERVLVMHRCARVTSDDIGRAAASP
jgi:hypothetical protein